MHFAKLGRTVLLIALGLAEAQAVSVLRELYLYIGRSELEVLDEDR